MSSSEVGAGLALLGLGGIYIMIGFSFVVRHAYAIAHARSTFWTRFRYTIYCTLAWPWVKVHD